MTKVKIILDDITKVKYDAIVNAANASLLGGGGVDGAIHKACGEQLLEECKFLQGCLTGSSKITRSYNLTTQGIFWIIHTVGPIYRHNGHENKYLRDCYRSVLNVAVNYASYYSEQCIRIINDHLYLFNSSRKKESTVDQFNKYISTYPIKTLAFSSISTGAYGFPIKEASKIALEEIFNFIKNTPNKLDEIAMVCFDKKTFDVYESTYNDLVLKLGE